MTLFLTIVIFVTILLWIAYTSYNYSERIRLEQELAYWKQAFQHLKQQQKAKKDAENQVLKEINKIINK